MFSGIWNVYDGEELLEGSIKCLRKELNFVIAVVQTISNTGNRYLGGFEECERLLKEGLIDYVLNYVPDLNKNASTNETIKRNEGLKIARRCNSTHFMMLDCDEYWEKLPEPDCAHELYTYFKEPTLQYDPIESYYVPGLISLRPNTVVGSYNCGFYCDPTRKPNHKLKLGTERMHHFSYVRKDINLKIQNSSAKSNIFAKKDALFYDLNHASDGYLMTYTTHKLKKVANLFDVKI